MTERSRLAMMRAIGQSQYLTLRYFGVVAGVNSVNDLAHSGTHGTALLRNHLSSRLEIE
ncbi:MAG TPA: hypothetical protein VFX16_23670 [Pseudonocardiaceae bacterium]|nr:hypothetical protein [Pseudonocardiaceae bacterium]